MKHLCLNLKRFDVPPAYGGVNRIAQICSWGGDIVSETQARLKDFTDARFTMYFPEAHLIPALQAKAEDSPIQVGCQGVFREDISVGGNFGAFTTLRPAQAMHALGVQSAIIGHCEERRDKAGVLAEAGVSDAQAVNRLLRREVQAAVAAGLSVLYCIGETAEERTRWQEVLAQQLEIGLSGVDTAHVAVAYEPVWAIGPGKTPPDRDSIQMTAKYVKQATGGLPVLYGGGLKQDNAKMLASIPEIDGGLIALTRFTGEIGFYPEEYLEIVRLYMEGDKAYEA